MTYQTQESSVLNTRGTMGRQVGKAKYTTECPEDSGIAHGTKSGSRAGGKGNEGVVGQSPPEQQANLQVSLPRCMDVSHSDFPSLQKSWSVVSMEWNEASLSCRGETLDPLDQETFGRANAVTRSIHGMDTRTIPEPVPQPFFYTVGMIRSFQKSPEDWKIVLWAVWAARGSPGSRHGVTQEKHPVESPAANPTVDKHQQCTQSFHSTSGSLTLFLGGGSLTLKYKQRANDFIRPFRKALAWRRPKPIRGNNSYAGRGNVF